MAHSDLEPSSETLSQQDQALVSPKFRVDVPRLFLGRTVLAKQLHTLSEVTL
jgi:hypothetical protein